MDIMSPKVPNMENRKLSQVQIGRVECRRRSQVQLGNVRRRRRSQVQLDSVERCKRVGLGTYFTFCAKNSAVGALTMNLYVKCSRIE
jgi:hypothetical protein